MPSQNVLEQLRTRLPYATLFSQLLGGAPLRGTGPNRTTLCIFHEDSSPSLSLNIENGLYRCFACNASGDFFDFYMRARGLEFRDAVDELCELMQIEQPRRSEPIDPERELRVLAAYTPPETVTAPADTPPAPDTPIVAPRLGSLEPAVPEPRAVRDLPPISNAIVEDFHEHLITNADALERFMRIRGLSRATIDTYQLGFDGERYTIPVYDADGVLRNIRRYLPGADAGQKMLSWRAGYGEARLYPLPRFLAHDLSTSRVVYIVEGELDALILRQEGFNAITGTGGAGTWKRQWNEMLRDRDVIICYDCDAPGRAGAALVAEQVRSLARSVRVLDLRLEEGEDVTDYFVRYGNTQGDFYLLAVDAPEWTGDVTPPPPDAVPEGTPGAIEVEDVRLENLTDLGNARRFVRDHGASARYTEGRRWLAWDGVRWRRDSTAIVARRAQETVKRIYAEAELIEDARVRSKVRAHATKSEGSGRLGAMLDLAATQAEIAMRDDAFDSHPLLLNCANGTVDLRTGDLRSAAPDDLMTRATTVRFDPDAECPQWQRFITWAMCGDAALLNFLQRWAGYCLTGLANEQALLLCYGIGLNGKSTTLETLRRAFGEYAMQSDFSTLAPKRGEGPRDDIARLVGSRLVTAIEASSGGKFNEMLVKQLTGEDVVTVRHLYQSAFEFRPTFKLMLAVNHRPQVSADNAVWRRVLLLPFDNRISDEQRDRSLGEKLADELPGILAWCVRGTRLWLEGGLQVPQRVRAEVEQYRAFADSLAGFLTTHVVEEPGAHVTAKELYEVYTTWCAGAGEEVLSQQLFGRQLNDRGMRADKRGPRGSMRRLGIRLKRPDEMLSDEERLGASTAADDEEPSW